MSDPLPTVSDIAYGPSPRHRVDIWCAPGDGPRPLAVYFHGGGFVHGDKSAYAPRVAPLLASGISVASANYRFVANAPDAAPFPAPQLDGVRALQYLRAHSAEWGVDPDRLAVVGGSAGANLGIWAALQPEQHPWVRCIVSYAGQSTNDPHVIQAEIGGGRPHPSMCPAFGIARIEEAEIPPVRALIESVSSLNYVGPTAPPALMIATSPMSDLPLPADVDPGYLIHHAMFGELLRRAYAAHGRSCTTYHAEAPMPAGADIRFLAEHLLSH